MMNTQNFRLLTLNKKFLQMFYLRNKMLPYTPTSYINIPPVHVINNIFNFSLNYHVGILLLKMIFKEQFSTTMYSFLLLVCYIQCISKRQHTVFSVLSRQIDLIFSEMRRNNQTSSFFVEKNTAFKLNFLKTTRFSSFQSVITLLNMCYNDQCIQQLTNSQYYCILFTKFLMTLSSTSLHALWSQSDAYRHEYN
uniref:Transmembrane protein n=1 Tax=Heterorhabditis bacteriophora TaxID=37862 RepID=A0A1I7W9T7_HETBA